MKLSLNAYSTFSVRTIGAFEAHSLYSSWNQRRPTAWIGYLEKLSSSSQIWKSNQTLLNEKLGWCWQMSQSEILDRKVSEQRLSLRTTNYVIMAQGLSIGYKNITLLVRHCLVLLCHHTKARASRLQLSYRMTICCLLQLPVCWPITDQSLP